MRDDSPAVVVVDENGEIVQVHKIGNQLKLAIYDNELLECLEKVLEEVKGIKKQIESITENAFESDELD